MKLNFQMRLYPGENPRPHPEVRVDEGTNSLFVAIPWGSRDAAQKVIDRMAEYLAFAAQDGEATSPLPRLSCLTTAANNLRTAALLANDMLFREDNRDQYHAGTEIFAATLQQNELSWIQIGGPQILLGRGAKSLLPLGSTVDLALDLQEQGSQIELPALPAQLMGLEANVNLSINSFRARAGDKILLINHSRPPEVIFSWRSDGLKMDEMIRSIAKESPRHAFWIGLLEIEATSLEKNSGSFGTAGEVA